MMTNINNQMRGLQEYSWFREYIEITDVVANDMLLIFGGFKDGIVPECNILDVFFMKGVY